MKILILVLSCQNEPYLKMVDTALETWDSIEVEDVETIYYFGNPVKENMYNKIYFPIEEGYFTMGRKALLAYEWVLNNKEFDYLARVHSSIYVDKKKLKEYVETLPKSIFTGVETDSQNGFRYCWGGTGYIISRDVLQQLVANKELWNHSYMEDESISLLCTKLNIPFTQMKAGAIDYMGEDEWRIISYNGESISFKDFKDLIPLNHHYYRIKQDGHRDRDEYIMKQLFENL